MCTMSEEDEKVLVPQVQWAQRKNMIIIRVLVRPVENPDFVIREDYMTFKGQAIGMSGKAQFGFELVFYEPVQSDHCRVKFLQSEIEFRLLKKEEGVWPRLQSSLEKPHWISLDFDQWEYQREEGEESDGEAPKIELSPEIMKKIEETQAQMEETESAIKVRTEQYNSAVETFSKMKTGYLLLYNGVQWSGFILIVLTLLGTLRGGMGPGGISTAYEKTVSMMMFCTALMLLEIFHAAFGIVRGSLTATILQVGGRFLMTFVVVAPAVEMHTNPVVFALFLVWSLIEVIRYPFYALSVIKYEVHYLTWLRYSAWIPLYPLGFTCEALAIWFSLEHYDSSEDFDYPLPNSLNISFYPPYILRCALLIVPLIGYTLISSMIAQRKRKLQQKPKTL